jgi:hypothetical protein
VTQQEAKTILIEWIKSFDESWKSSLFLVTTIKV